MTILGQSAGALAALIHRSHPTTRSMAQNLILMSPPDVSFSQMAASQSLAKNLAAILCGNAQKSPRECLSLASTRAILNVYDDEKTKSTFRLPDASLLPVGRIFSGF